MVLAGVAMLLLALAAIGMVLASAGLQDKDAQGKQKTGDGEASRVPAAEEDCRGYLGRAVAVR
ncbi:hypothetical protein [Labedaea rhizosphaerae]|uniref:Uncharacterized protein n=1 Tax=Labedaea rhizosphaerae TaxID=598644 RepID=A0A4V3D0C2_LABRH|nr:hypothetical protein [Labedaea rhizosphaerae]TDQ05255.1 hypothetical protein EV186_1011223 [Labedaea rhizosphaerae]